jgi:hypothetical protein
LTSRLTRENGRTTGIRGKTNPIMKLAGNASRWMGSIEISAAVGLAADGEVRRWKANQSGVIKAFEWLNWKMPQTEILYSLELVCIEPVSRT